MPHLAPPTVRRAFRTRPSTACPVIVHRHELDDTIDEDVLIFSKKEAPRRVRRAAKKELALHEEVEEMMSESQRRDFEQLERIRREIAEAEGAELVVEIVDEDEAIGAAHSRALQTLFSRLSVAPRTSTPPVEPRTRRTKKRSPKPQPQPQRAPSIVEEHDEQVDENSSQMITRKDSIAPRRTMESIEPKGLDDASAQTAIRKESETPSEDEDDSMPSTSTANTVIQRQSSVSPSRSPLASDRADSSGQDESPRGHFVGAPLLTSTPLQTRRESAASGRIAALSRDSQAIEFSPIQPAQTRPQTTIETPLPVGLTQSADACSDQTMRVLDVSTTAMAIAAAERRPQLQPQILRGSSVSARPSVLSSIGDFNDSCLSDIIPLRDATNRTLLPRNVSIISHDGSLIGPSLPFYLSGISLKGATTAHEIPAFDQLLYVCQQSRLLPWTEAFDASFFQTVKKLGEGTFAEVFATTLNGQPVAVKVMPIERSAEERTFDGMVNGEYMKTAGEVLPEVLITQALAALDSPEETFSTSTFIALRSARVVKGAYPPSLLSAWNEFDKRRGSENDHPEEYASPDRLFLCLTLAMGGTDLEQTKLTGECAAMSIFLQLAFALQVSEQRLEFEHRDLHWGNLLVDKTSQQSISFRVNGTTVHVRAHGVRVSIIDYTLSRMSKDGTTLYLDLEKDEELFEGRGRGEEGGDYQFDLYRAMRKHNQGRWEAFSPKTNVLWLHYIAEALFERKPFSKKKLTAKRKAELRKIFDGLLEADSVAAFITSEGFYSIVNEYVSVSNAEDDV